MHTRLKALQSRHASLEARLQREQKRPAPDLFHVRTLKKFKLRIRDEIKRLERGLERRRHSDLLPR
ncbi:YdcH family protein [Roseibium aquae]|uniref:YdcH family protein n=1 Tax=Roseibium aquae TaxID=1323746 RepID=UPI00123CD875|nr:DUF465 domain-containing protein [Roseibium aquae]